MVSILIRLQNVHTPPSEIVVCAKPIVQASRTHHQLAIMSDERPSDALQPNAKRRAAGQGSKDDVEEEEEEVRQRSCGERTAHARL